MRKALGADDEVEVFPVSTDLIAAILGKRTVDGCATVGKSYEEHLKDWAESQGHPAVPRPGPQGSVKRAPREARWRPTPDGAHAWRYQIEKGIEAWMPRAIAPVKMADIA